MAAGNLWVNLGLRTAAFDRGLSKSRKGIKGFGGSVQGVSRQMRRFGTTILAAAGIGGIGYMIKQQMTAIDSTAKLSDRIGMGTEALVGMQHAANICGVQAETLNKSLEIFSRRLGEVDMGVGQAKYALDQLGLNYEQLIDKSPDQAIGIVADQINRLGSQSQKAAAANYLFGRSGQQLLNLFAQGSAGIAELRLEADRLGLTFSRIDAAKVEAANDALTRTKAVFTGLARSVTIELSPYIEAAATAFNDWATSGEGVAAKVVDAFEAVAIAISTVATETQELSRRMNVFLDPIDTLRRSSAATEAAYNRYRALTGDTRAGRTDNPLYRDYQPKDRELFNQILQEEQMRVGLIAQDRRALIEKTFASLRENAAAGSSLPAAVPPESLGSGQLLNFDQRRMSTEDYAVHLAEITAMDEARVKSEEEFGKKMIENAERVAAAQKRIADQTAAKWQQVGNTMEYSMTSAFDRIVWQAESWGDAMAGIARDVAREISRVMILWT